METALTCSAAVRWTTYLERGSDLADSRRDGAYRNPSPLTVDPAATILATLDGGSYDPRREWYDTRRYEASAPSTCAASDVALLLTAESTAASSPLDAPLRSIRSDTTASTKDSSGTPHAAPGRPSRYSQAGKTTSDPRRSRNSPSFGVYLARGSARWDRAASYPLFPSVAPARRATAVQTRRAERPTSRTERPPDLEADLSFGSDTASDRRTSSASFPAASTSSSVGVDPRRRSSNSLPHPTREAYPPALWSAVVSAEDADALLPDKPAATADDTAASPPSPPSRTSERHDAVRSSALADRRCLTTLGTSSAP